MDLNYLKKLLKIFDESTAYELTIEEEGIKIKLSRQNKFPQSQIQSVSAQSFIPPSLPGGLMQTPPAEVFTTEKFMEKQLPETDSPVLPDNLHEIKSPIVGTFYRSPAPDAPPYVEVGSHIEVGSTMCIIEAMKLMNEIESDSSGTVIKILVSNSQPVEFGQALFIIKPD